MDGKRLFSLLVVCLFFYHVLSAKATTFTVNTLVDSFDGVCDSSNCSLRDAISAADSSPVADNIVFSVSGTIALDSLNLGCIDILASNNNLTINGGSQINIQTNGASAFCVYADNVTIQNLRVFGSTALGQALIFIQSTQDSILENLVVENNPQGGGIYLDSVINANIRNSIIRNNGFSGIKFQNSLGSEVGGLVGLVPAPNQIYSNGQEGVVIEDSSFITVWYNYIGTNNSSTGPTTDTPVQILPNQNSGVAIVSTASGQSNNNVITRNRIAYNRYENVLVRNQNTQQNEISFNHIYSDFCASQSLPPNNGVVISQGAKGNVVRTNRIECHRYNGVQIVGTGTDKNGVIDHDGSNFTSVAGSHISTIRKSDAVVLVTNDYNNSGFPTVSTSSPIPAGPSDTVIVNNTIEEGTYHGIHAILSTNMIIGKNTIRGNGINGILLVGASAYIGEDDASTPLPNTIAFNGQSGIRVEAHYGNNTSYLNYADDVNSVASIRNNSISDNGLVGIFGVDNEADDVQSPQQLNITNSIGTHPWTKIVQQWFGAVEILDALNNPITTITAGAIFSPTCNNTYQLQTYNNGAWGPPGFVLNNLNTWFYPPYGSLITDDFVDNSNNYISCNPMTISALSGVLYGTAIFSFDGNSNTHPVIPDNVLPFSSPNATKNARYQIAEIKLLAPSSSDVVLSGRVVDEKGNGIRNVIITVSGGRLSSPLKVRTNTFGYYSLQVTAGEAYIISAFSKRHVFKPSEYTLIAQEDLTDLDFVAVGR
ncbi:MAG: right-handed parallel beta-helix repeat-containing protein [Pyrinomonadaceae bacterium]|nr:right-handed parallel beta-helix repeat-containing protein [Pyrinomonadaceae bacterium]MCX7639452.1 right-handed parallel beta-helix repeat-containing protein [Pyrinomonadaceae bacterium]MDW8304498.1 CSLREA domain-containing protein [Acidobacteriota bacterium]